MHRVSNTQSCVPRPLCDEKWLRVLLFTATDVERGVPGLDRSSEAERLHSGLTSAFTALIENLAGSSVETGAGYVFFLCSEAPLPQCNGVWAATPTGVLAPFYKATLLELHGLSYYLGFAGGEAVSTAVGYRETDTVGIFNVATPPGNRRRGYGAALTSLAARDGIERGAQLAWLQASQHGEPVYRRMGFRQVETYNRFTRS